MNTVNSTLSDLLNGVGSLLIVFLIAYVKQHYSARQVESAKNLASEAVSMAQELGITDSLSGSQKLKEAIKFAKTEAVKVGIKKTDEQWEAYILSAKNKTRSIIDQVQGYSAPLKQVMDSPQTQQSVPSSSSVPTEGTSTSAQVQDTTSASQTDTQDKQSDTTQPPSTIQPIIAAAEEAGRVAYNQVVQDSITAASGVIKQA